MLNFLLLGAEFFYKIAINSKNFLYETGFLKETKVKANVICIGNLTTGGVGKTPIVETLSKILSKEKKVAILCSDEAYQLAKKTPDNVAVIICKDRLKAANYAIYKYNSEVIILDDGFSNRKIKKDKTFIVIDSKMRLGSNRLLPLGPLREPVCEIKRADEIIIVNKIIFLYYLVKKEGVFYGRQ